MPTPDSSSVKKHGVHESLRLRPDGRDDGRMRPGGGGWAGQRKSSSDDPNARFPCLHAAAVPMALVGATPADERAPRQQHGTLQSRVSALTMYGQGVFHIRRGPKVKHYPLNGPNPVPAAMGS